MGGTILISNFQDTTSKGSSSHFARNTTSRSPKSQQRWVALLDRNFDINSPQYKNIGTMIHHLRMQNATLRQDKSRMAKEIDGLKKRLDDTKMTTKRFEEIRR